MAPKSNVFAKIIQWLFRHFKRNNKKLKPPKTTKKKGSKTSKFFPFKKKAEPKKEKEITNDEDEDSDDNGPNATLHKHLLKIGKKSKFGKRLKKFIQLVLNSKESDLEIIMMNIREFMDDFKNDLIANCDRKFSKELEIAQASRPRHFNLDDVLEKAVVELVLIPLKEHLETIMVENYSSKLTRVMENMFYIRNVSLADIGCTATISQYTEDEIGVINQCFYRMQSSRSPIEKMKNYLMAVSYMHDFAKSFITGKKLIICADDFIPLLIWILSHCRTFTAELDGLYMWHLMNPALKTGEYGYYVTSLMCAASLLNDPDKLFNNDPEESCPCIVQHSVVGNSQGASTSSARPDLFMAGTSTDYQLEYNTFKVVALDEFSNLPIAIKLNDLDDDVKVKDICSILAKKLRTSHPDSNALFALFDNIALMLTPNDSPKSIMESIERRYGKMKTIQFVYKEINRKLGWPFDKQIITVIN